jgi:hypothetical protein
MTGPEHYARAERLLADIDYDGPRLWSDKRNRATRGYGAEVVAAVAQAHATLALAAATALTNSPDPFVRARHTDDWLETAGKPETEVAT